MCAVDLEQRRSPIPFPPKAKSGSINWLVARLSAFIVPSVTAIRCPVSFILSPLQSQGGDEFVRRYNGVGDRWTVLVLRELFMGSHRFDEIQSTA
jgi:hypothetical protein